MPCAIIIWILRTQTVAFIAARNDQSHESAFTAIHTRASRYLSFQKRPVLVAFKHPEDLRMS